MIVKDQSSIHNGSHSRTAKLSRVCTHSNSLIDWKSSLANISEIKIHRFTSWFGKRWNEPLIVLLMLFRYAIVLIVVEMFDSTPLFLVSLPVMKTCFHCIPVFSLAQDNPFSTYFSMLIVWLGLLVYGLSEVSAQVPIIHSLSPAAARPGHTTTVTVKGTGLQTVTSLWNSFPAEVKLREGSAKANEVQFDVKLSKEVAPGLHACRVVSKQGISALSLLMVDDLPSVAQQTNTTPENSQHVELPVAIDGVVNAASLHTFQFDAKAGEQITFEIYARRFGSALDPVLRLLDEQKRELVYNDDAAGLFGDARFSAKIPHDGKYVLELRDIQYRGGKDYRFRLYLGAFPVIQVAYPFGIQRGIASELSFVGEQSSDVEPITVTPSKTETQKWLYVGAKRKGGSLRSSAQVAITDRLEYREQEPNNELKSANVCNLESNWNGRLEQPGDVDFFRFQAEKGDRIGIRTQTRMIGLSTDLVLTLMNAKGNTLIEMDDAGTNDAILKYQIPVKGEYILKVRDLHRRGGSDQAYRLLVSRNESRFVLKLDRDSLNIPTNGTVAVSVTAVRLGYDGPISLDVIGLPKGMQVVKTIIGPKQTRVTLTIQSTSTNTIESSGGKLFPIQVVGTGTQNGKTLKSTASILTSLQTRNRAMLFVPFPPGRRSCHGNIACEGISAENRTDRINVETQRKRRN